MAVARSCSSASRRTGQVGWTRIPRLLGSIHPELWVFATAILLLNLHVLPGLAALASEPRAFFPDRFAAGEWWLLLTHPLVHVSGYHLLLDAAAFFILHASLETRSLATRLSVVAASAAGSLAAAWMLCPQIESVGFCGLSGVDHGLMTFGALELMRRGVGDRRTFAQGAICLATVLVKSFLELVSGQCLFDFVHLGSVGMPLAPCHFGGAIGGAAAFAAMCRAKMCQKA